MRRQFTPKTIHFVTSKDGTRIEYRQFGANKPGIIIIPGALAKAAEFDPLAHILSQNFTAYTIERRGRGASGPQGKDYSIEKEIQDIDALQKHTGATVVFGHSFGGFVALEYARKRPIKHVVAFEPGISVDNSIPAEWMQESRQHLECDKPLDAMVAFTQAMNPDSAKAPRWLLKRILPIAIGRKELREKLELLDGTIREHAEEVRLDNTHHNYREISAKILLICGGKPSAATPGTAKLAYELPHITLQTFAKMDHFGPEKHPETIAKKIAEFAIS